MGALQHVTTFYLYYFIPITPSSQPFLSLMTSYYLSRAKPEPRSPESLSSWLQVKLRHKRNLWKNWKMHSQTASVMSKRWGTAQCTGGRLLWMFTDVPSWPSPRLHLMSLLAIKFQLGVPVCASVAGVLLPGIFHCQSLGIMVIFTVSVPLDHCFRFIHAVFEMGTSFRYFLEDLAGVRTRFGESGV